LKLADLSHGGSIYRRISFHKRWEKELIPLRGCTKGGKTIPKERGKLI